MNSGTRRTGTGTGRGGSGTARPAQWPSRPDRGGRVGSDVGRRLGGPLLGSGTGSGTLGMVGTTGPGAGTGPPGPDVAPEAGVDGATVGVEDVRPPPGVWVGRAGADVRAGVGAGVLPLPAGAAAR